MRGVIVSFEAALLFLIAEGFSFDYVSPPVTWSLLPLHYSPIWPLIMSPIWTVTLPLCFHTAVTVTVTLLPCGYHCCSVLPCGYHCCSVPPQSAGDVFGPLVEPRLRSKIQSDRWEGRGGHDVLSSGSLLLLSL